MITYKVLRKIFFTCNVRMMSTKFQFWFYCKIHFNKKLPHFK